MPRPAPLCPPFPLAGPLPGAAPESPAANPATETPAGKTARKTAPGMAPGTAPGTAPGMAVTLAATLAVGTAIVLAVAPAPAGAQDPAAPPPFVRTVFLLPAEIGGRTFNLEALEIRPRGPGPFPLALVLHGKPSGESRRKALNPQTLTVQALEFARRGYIAVAALRRGYGKSEGPYAESDGTCAATRYSQATRQGAIETRAIAAAAARRPGADPQRLVIAGESVGGIVALALAQDPPMGAKAAINFAGGRGHDPNNPGHVCESEKLVALAGALGADAKIPTLWIYAENDALFGPSLARAMFAAFERNGGLGNFALLPPIARDGHAVFARNPADWAPAVDGFLQRLGLPAGIRFARPAEDPPAATGPAGKRAFAQYRADPKPFRAFAVSGTGAFGWAATTASIEEARREAERLCRLNAPQCRVAAERAEIEDR
jgi:dienelactone hydrolase